MTTGKRSFVVAVVLATSLTACGHGDGTPTITPVGPFPTTATVTMPAFTFLPPQTDIGVGGVVSFEFPAEPHNVIFRQGTAGAPTNIEVTSNVTISRQFNVTGTFPYDCMIHPGMSGTIIVH